MLLPSLAALAGCFAEPTSVESAGASDTGGTSSTQSPSTSTTAADETSTGETGSDNTTFFVSTGDSTDTGTSSGCPLGEEGCPCTDPVEPTCESDGLVCVEGTCVPAAAECVVSYGGAGSGVTISMAAIAPNGDIVSHSELEFAGMHQPSADMAGQDMLTVCNGYIYAVLMDSAEVEVLEIGDSGTLNSVGRFAVPANGPAGPRSLRALECAAPHAPSLLVFSVVETQSETEFSVLMHSLPLDEGGGLGQAGAPVVFGLEPGTSPNRVRTAYSAATGRGFVIYDHPLPTNGSFLQSFEVEGGSGAVMPGPDSMSTIAGIQSRLGGIAVTPTGNVALVGAQVGNPQGAGASVHLTIEADGSYNPAFDATADTGRDTFHFDAKSVVFGRGAESLVGSAESFAAMRVEGGAPVLGPPIPLQGAGPVYAFRVHDGQVVVALDAESIHTFGGPEVPLEAATDELDAMNRELPSLDAAVTTRCPLPRLP